MKKDIVLDVHEKPSPEKWLLFSIQHLFAMFGATILVPFLVGLPPAVALVSSGVGTLAYLLITRGQIPAYLGSSFAFISPILIAKEGYGMGGAMVGSFLAGIVYGIVALCIATFGVGWIKRILPPVVVGPVIIVIGLGLAGTAISMSMNDANGEYSTTNFLVALATLGITILCSVVLKGFFKLVPILIGIVSGYTIAAFAGLVDFTNVIIAEWIQAPDFFLPFLSYTPSFSWSIVAIMVPVAIVTLAEHTGDQLVLSKVVGKNFIEKPGLHRSILGDGVATVIASLIGGPPNTTYGENIGVLAITRVYSVYVVAGAAVLAVAFGFIGKISALISSIPTPVMGGVSILLFGIIASSGLRMLIDNGVNLENNRNLIISSVILVIGIGGAFIKLTADVSLSGMALAAIVGVVLNLVLPGGEIEESQLFEESEVKNSIETA
ncbi:uracil permease [Bacillus coahuilensis p1.1.43]|uniref:Uracil permease n=1 Tax=Bacillus coahuilensis p1.1.43 TaxID=1150625 RepID=A0A147K9B4_9BACI|nr:solute carrier family 23 protein [Bacillus coahuilensis]KUP07038.1 uracil permease [Bacillus coahuilensis p1.1.43]